MPESGVLFEYRLCVPLQDFSGKNKLLIYFFGPPHPFSTVCRFAWHNSSRCLLSSTLSSSLPPSHSPSLFFSLSLTHAVTPSIRHTYTHTLSLSFSLSLCLSLIMLPDSLVTASEGNGERIRAVKTDVLRHSEQNKG